MSRLRCWWQGHAWFTATFDGRIVRRWHGSPDYVTERDGLFVVAPPCRDCGEPNPNRP